MVLQNSAWLSTSIARLEVWSAGRCKEATQHDILIGDHPVEGDKIVVQSSKTFVSRSSDHGKSGQREERVIPGIEYITSSPRSAVLPDGTILVPVYGSDKGGNNLSFLWRSGNGGEPWSHPLLTDTWAPHSPAHLIKLTNGRILCSYGYLRAPMGIRAVLSHDGGAT